MDKKIKKNIVIIGLFALAIGMSASCYFYFSRTKAPLARANSFLANVASAKNGASPAVGMVLQYPADYSNDRILVGASHNVFVGKVIQQIGNKERGLGPETQFEVQVVLNIKGNLQGMVTVDQEGGYAGGVRYYVADGAPLLTPGATYLLATRYNAQENWYTLNPSRFGSEFIINDSGLSVDQLQVWADNDQRVEQLKTEYPHEVLPDADVKNNNTLNSYQSLHGKAPQSSSNISPGTSNQ